VQSGYIDPDLEKVLVPDVALRREGKPEDVADAVLFFNPERARWVTGQVLLVHGVHGMALGQKKIPDSRYQAPDSEL
jgi:NAD(P)-dependent dehydrogenase (short-subunit alcohol dehydrogenase family)